MTDSKREARTWWLNFNARVDGTDAPPLVSKDYDHFGHNNVSVEVIEKSAYDSLLKENQELRDEERKMLARLHRQSAIMAEKDAKVSELQEQLRDALKMNQEYARCIDMEQKKNTELEERNQRLIDSYESNREATLKAWERDRAEIARLKVLLSQVLGACEGIELRQDVPDTIKGWSRKMAQEIEKTLGKVTG